jgi:hypothetical protein
MRFNVEAGPIMDAALDIGHHPPQLSVELRMPLLMIA